MPEPARDETGSGRGSHSWWWVAAGSVLLVVGVGWWYAQPGSAPAVDPSTDSAPTRQPASSPAGVSRAALPEAAPARSRPGSPRRVIIPALEVDAEVVPIGAPGGTLTPPSDPRQLGWWAAGAKPGARQGSALVTGHTVSTGGGALDDLETLTGGDEVQVRTPRGQIRYVVGRVQTYSKGRLAEQATRLFSQEVPGRLVLITCEDWDGVKYLSNVVVIATPTPV